MKRILCFLMLIMLPLSLISCKRVGQRPPFVPSITDRTDAVVEILQTDRSTTELPETVATTTAPIYFEIVATGTTAPETSKSPDVDRPKEFYTVKFVDTDGYTSISVQTVEEGHGAIAPIMAKSRGDLVFRGWDKDFSNVQSGMIVKAIYQKEWLNVRFFDSDGSLLKYERVRYGKNATPPKIEDKQYFLFDGWNADYTKVEKDIDVYASYSPISSNNYTTLSNAYKLLPVAENTTSLAKDKYIRQQFEDVCTFGDVDYFGNIFYGNFSDTIEISGFGFKSFNGIIGLRAKTDDEYSVALSVALDGQQNYYTVLTRNGTYREFDIDTKGVKKITIRLETYKNGVPYYSKDNFVGGIVNAKFYEK